jgi:hypothetical protein
LPIAHLQVAYVRDGDGHPTTLLLGMAKAFAAKHRSPTRPPSFASPDRVWVG